MKVYFWSSIVITPAIDVASFMIPDFLHIPGLAFGRLLPGLRFFSFFFRSSSYK